MRSMKHRKLSGARLAQFFERLYAADSGLAPATRQNLVQRSVLAFSSARVRPGGRLALGMPLGAATGASVDAAAALMKPTAFDAYAIGLVPTFQREGRAGLLAKLAVEGDRTNLLAMARAQQIALDARFKSDDGDVATLCEAIADAVEKRVKNRQSASE